MKYILAADDEPVNLLLIEEMLMDEYEIKCVGDGLQCLKSVEDRLPDLILLDVAMPGMTGLEVCKQLHDNDKTRHIPVIILSGFASKEDIARGFEAGADFYISKPFRPATLREEIQKQLSD
ncbi:MAG: response regulator [Gammaproteobacteria bacterium]|nr:response regulator [Gammaproteobacteria bacterium]MDH5799527.1 response regulator [Gammaproteobacteria bacterium]